MRGFTREVLSILAWAGAAIAAYLLFPVLREPVRDFLDFQPEHHFVADIIQVTVVFILVLITISVLTMRISDWILDSGVGPLDRTLGFLFGLVRGLLLVVIAYLFFNWLVPEQHPSWISEAKARPIIEGTGRFLIKFLPPETQQALNLDQFGMPRPAGSAGSGDEPVQPGNGDTRLQPDDDDPDRRSQADSGGDSGYLQSERRSLNQLLESSAGRGHTGE